MADNVAITPGTGATIASDDVGGVQYQRVKVNYGADGTATDVTPGAGFPMAGSYTELTGSASANSIDLVASTDVRAYKCWSLQLSGTFVASVSVQCSNDNTTWYSMVGSQVNSAATTPTTTFTAAGMWNGMIQGRYIRVRTFAYTSGTVNATVELTSETGPVNGVYVNGYLANQLANTATGTTGAGVPAAAPVYFDGTNYQRTSPSTPLPVTIDAGTLLSRLEELLLVTRQLLSGAGAQIPDLTGRTRVALETLSASATLATVTTVTTVGTLSRLGGVNTPAEQMFLSNPAALALRDRIQVS